MATVRQSKYIRPDDNNRKPFRFTERWDLPVLELFAPGQYQYLTAETIALLTERSHNATQHRLQLLFQHEFLGRWYPPQFDYTGGSPKSVYFLDAAGAQILRQNLGRPVSPKKLRINEYRPFLMHSILIDQYRALIKKAALDAGLQIAYEFRDKEFRDFFEAEKRTVSKSGHELMNQVKYSLIPDWLFAFAPSQGENGQIIPTRNFYVEVQRSNRLTKVSSQKDRRSLIRKFEAYYYFYRHQRWQQWPERKYPKMESHKNMRVLWLTEMSEQEHNNVIELARTVDERGQGLRLFWFCRLANLSANPLQRITEAIWQTPVKGDSMRSIFFSP